MCSNRQRAATKNSPQGLNLGYSLLCAEDAAVRFRDSSAILWAKWCSCNVEQAAGRCEKPQSCGTINKEHLMHKHRENLWMSAYSSSDESYLRCVFSVRGRWKGAAWRGMRAKKMGREGREERENDTETGAKLFSESRMRTGVAEEVRETTMRSRLWRQGSGNVQQEGCCSRCFSTFESKVGDMGSGTMSGHLRSVQTGSQTEYVRLERLQLRWSELVCPFASDDILIQPVKEMGYFNEVRFFFLILIMQNPSKLLSFCMLSMV